LEEGEFLFVPKGIWHYTETDDVNSSLHITFGLHPPRKIDLIDSFIRSNFNDSCEENVYGANFEKIKSILSDFINEINTKEIEFDEEKIQDFLKNNIVKYTEVELT
jgi:ribosomal protein L16 Arg81 hydroxylase